MASQALSSVENNFTKGLVTEFTGLNFPENAAIDADNVVFSLIGDTTRRLGFDFETNYVNRALDRTNSAVNSYKWDNAGGDGVSQFVVVQAGGSVTFYRSSSATTSNPLSGQYLATLDLTQYVAAGATFDISKECTFADGNGYLFIFHPDCDPMYCKYSAGGIIAYSIFVKVRDVTGIPETDVSDNLRPSSLSDSHKYNLINQGWTSGNPWSASSTSTVASGVGVKVFTIAAGLTITAGEIVQVNGYSSTGGSGAAGKDIVYMSGSVTSYVGTTLTLSITSVAGVAGTYSIWTFVPITTGKIGDWFTAIGNYPSNADQWWRFKNTSGVFSPGTTQTNLSIGSGAAPKGHILLNAFTQYRTVLSGVSGLADISTTVRPNNGAWFQGRVWYTGVNASAVASGTAPYTTWTENIYFSQTVFDESDFAKCHQENDPTSELLFDLLSTDGGVITIQGSGPVYKLFPIQNGMLVFAGNGIWFITGSQGIGFSANDYTITHISNVRSISSTSFVNVQGLPYFWNEEGIYTVQPSKGGGLEVNPITSGTILSFYDEIPLSSKKYARAAYDPVDYTIKWIYKNTEAAGVTDRYFFDRVLNFNTYNKAFYPYSVAQPTLAWPAISGIIYVAGTGGATVPSAAIKYVTFYVPTGPYVLTFTEEKNTNYTDWFAARGGNTYESSFTTGYRLRGQGQKRFQIPYIYVFSRTDNSSVAYKIQGLWDYATSGASGRWSTLQIVNIDESNYDMVFRRHKIRGQGLVLQFKIKSVEGEPFDIMGWSAYETANTGV